MDTIATAKLSPFGLAGLREHVDKLNRRADKLGVEPILVSVVDTVVETDVCDREFYVVRIEGTAPRVNGWALAAKVERHDIVGTLVSVVPGPYADEDYSEYHDCDFHCDHCNSKRGRHSVYVLRHQDGRRQVVGTNCLADFVRYAGAADLALFAEMSEQLVEGVNDGEFERLGGGVAFPPLTLVHFLSLVRAVIRRVGWTSRTDAKEYGYQSTADLALEIIYSNHPSIQKFVEKNEIEVNDNDRELAAKAIEWAKSAGGNEYLRTISLIALAGETDRKLAGYAASIIPAYQRAMDREAERAAADGPEKVYAGEPGKTRDIGEVTVKRVRYTDGFYGTKTIVAMEQELPGNRVAPIVWFASGSLEFGEGERYHLRAAIKECRDDERFGKQTVVSRAKLT